MDNETSAFLTAQAKHNRFMTYFKKQRYIEVFQCSGEDMNMVLTGAPQNSVAGSLPLGLQGGLQTSPTLQPGGKQGGVGAPGMLFMMRNGIFPRGSALQPGILGSPPPMLVQPRFIYTQPAPSPVPQLRFPMLPQHMGHKRTWEDAFINKPPQTAFFPFFHP